MSRGMGEERRRKWIIRGREKEWMGRGMENKGMK